MKTRVVLLGGPYNGLRPELDRCPDVILVGRMERLAPRHRYEAVRDPDTKDFLGGYAWAPPALLWVLDERGGTLGRLADPEGGA